MSPPYTQAQNPGKIPKNILKRKAQSHKAPIDSQSYSDIVLNTGDWQKNDSLMLGNSEWPQLDGKIFLGFLLYFWEWNLAGKFPAIGNLGN
jgi:hypothetical protein